MDKRILITHTWLLFIYLALFPFGQLFKLISQLAESTYFFHPTDSVIVFNALLFLATNNWRKTFNRQYLFPVCVLVFSLVYASSALGIMSLSSVLYLIRLLSYGIFGVTTLALLRTKMVSRTQLVRLLLTALSVSAVFGWIQYLFFSDLTSLYILGWDDHLLRLTGTFLDPAFTGIILVIGFVIAFYKKSPLLQFFFLLSLIFTYSRASFLSLVIAFIYMIGFKPKKSHFIVALLLIILLITSSFVGTGEGVQLLRTKSALLKIENFVLGLSIFYSSPLFGIGFNNLCLLDHTRGVNSCSGLDNSYLMILVTTGVVGITTFYHLVMTLISGTKPSVYQKILFASVIAIGVHSLFTNTLFYPWVLGIVAILFALSCSITADKS